MQNGGEENLSDAIKEKMEKVLGKQLSVLNESNVGSVNKCVLLSLP